jgi:predicted nucleic acid-binding protein
VNTFVIDASVALKWVVEEDGTAEALALRRVARLIAPELIIPECANILWKKVQRGQISQHEAFLAARLLQAADVECLPTRSLLE